MAEKTGNQDKEISELLQEHKSNRTKLESYIGKLQPLLDKVDGLFPATLDYRNKFVIEEKIKTMSVFFGTILNFQQEINRSVVSEIEIRRKMTGVDNELSSMTIGELADQVEKSLQTKSGPQESVPE